jgi:hypothetical protein
MDYKTQERYKNQEQIIETAKLLANDYERALGMYDLWLEYNWEIFNGELEPLIIMVHNVTCYGNQWGHYHPKHRKIYIWENLNPFYRKQVLLHEMAHQYAWENLGQPNDVDCHNCQEWCDVWNNLILPKTGFGQYCLTLKKRTKRLDRELGKQVNVKQLVWVPSCGDRIPLAYDVAAHMGHDYLYEAATEEWAKGCEPKVLEAA